MPIDYMVLDQGIFVYARAFGTLTDEDLLEHERRLLDDTRVARGFKQLLDGRWVVDDQSTDRGLERLTAIRSGAPAKLRGARYALVTHSPRWFSVSTRYARDEGGVSLIAFNDPSTACIWLGVDYNALMGSMLFAFPPVMREAAPAALTVPAPGD